MDNIEFLLTLQFGLCGTARLRHISAFLKQVGRIEALRALSDEEFLHRFHEPLSDILERGKGHADPSEELHRAGKNRIRITLITDDDYPSALKTISDAPLFLYSEGDLKHHSELCLAMVGTRRPSLYGIETARRLARELASSGIIIVSGLARGIDTCAHEGALEVEGKTFGVLGSGLLNPYPAENRRLIERIKAEGGAIVSELPLTAPPLPHHFPLRNRIISGLSQGVCVVEASTSSGSLITARAALEEGRDVYAVPGMMHSLTSQGALELIQQGAKLVRSSGDIAEDFYIQIRSLLDHPPQDESS